MSNTTSTLAVCETLISEHREMERVLARLEGALSSLNSEIPGTTAAVQSVMAHITPAMNLHFACEERVLFPAVSPYHPMDLMEAEHETLLDLRQELLTLLSKSTIENEGYADLRALGNRFISEMLDHIGREDAGIFPACERSLSQSEKEDVIAGMINLRAQFAGS